jgi:hypothetical protein
MIINTRIYKAIKNAEPDEVCEIVQAACRLEGSLYRDDSSKNKEVKDNLYQLRKALEGIFGHDIPENGYD